MIATIVALIDRLFPPTVERILASLNRTHDRLAASAAANHRNANSLLNQSDVVLVKAHAEAADLWDAATKARDSANRASRIKTNIANLIGGTN